MYYQHQWWQVQRYFPKSFHFNISNRFNMGINLVCKCKSLTWWLMRMAAKYETLLCSSERSTGFCKEQNVLYARTGQKTRQFRILAVSYGKDCVFILNTVIIKILLCEVIHSFFRGMDNFILVSEVRVCFYFITSSTL